ncbi:hypothetical protein [Granulicella tundricola]|uniref:Uncharacterized protein n=1 Tax=Granulicella tundricola (strain ATCC BAA-1859 / DSM 23138 / MP5ACTX9) TaxID=1198114 RepID=E8X660_GRATM|nr:hypothetical protein [Granulicella tundricola]ADW70944.1 hypothetical protein AciX9_4164 [Granulicella tundricola MP5ACTX9]
MLYEPFPGGAAVVLTQLGLLEEGQAEGLGVRTFDAESGRLSLAMDDGRVIELVRATHARIENRYAVLVRAGGLAEDRGFIQIDRNFGVTDLLKHQVVYPETAHDEPVSHVSEDEMVDAPSDEVVDDETTRIHEVKRPVETQVTASDEIEASGDDKADAIVAEAAEAEVEPLAEVEEARIEDWDWAEPVRPFEPVDEAKAVWIEPVFEVVPDVEAGRVSQVEAEVESVPVVVTEAEDLPNVETEALAVAEAELEDESVAAAPEVHAEDEADAARMRYYRPLVEAFEPDVVVMFGWIAETGTIQTYEHRATGRYMHIDGASGLFYDQTRTPISQAAALRHAMPTDSVRERAKAAFFEEPPIEETPEAPAMLATRQSVRVSDEAPHGDELGLDTFVRKDANGGEPNERESWRKRIAGLGRTFRLGKNMGRGEE